MTGPIPPIRDPVTGEPVEPAARGRVYRAQVPMYVRVIQLIWFLAGLVDVLVALRFVLKLFGASIASPFVALVYGLSAPLVGPFANIFPVSGQGPFVFEPAALVALLIYPLVALGAVSLIRILSQRRQIVA